MDERKKGLERKAEQLSVAQAGAEATLRRQTDEMVMLREQHARPGAAQADHLQQQAEDAVSGEYKCRDDSGATAGDRHFQEI